MTDLPISTSAMGSVAAFPALREGFSGSTSTDLSWVLNAYIIVYAAFLVPAGRLVDLRGARQLFIGGVLLFTLASTLGGVAMSVPVLVVARVLQAAGAAVLSAASLTIALAVFPVGWRMTVVGYCSAAGALGATIGAGLGGVLIEATGWRAAFLVNLPLGALLLAFALRSLPAMRAGARGEALDWLGVSLIIVGMATLTWGVVSFGEVSGAALLGVVVVGIAALATYVAWAQGRSYAAIDLRLFHDRTYATITIATFVFGIAFAMLFLSSFLFLTGIWGFSEGTAGLALVPGPITAIVVAIGSGRIVRRVGQRRALVAGGLLFMLAQVWLWMMISAGPTYWSVWFPAQIVGGVAVGLLLAGLGGVAVANLPASRLSVGGAVNNATQQLGGVIGTALGVVFVGSQDASLADFHVGFLTLATLGLATALICLPVQTVARRAS